MELAQTTLQSLPSLSLLSAPPCVCSQNQNHISPNETKIIPCVCSQNNISPSKRIPGGLSAFLLPMSSTFLTSAGLALLFGSSQAALWALTTPIVVDMQVRRDPDLRCATNPPGSLQPDHSVWSCHLLQVIFSIYFPPRLE